MSQDPNSDTRTERVAALLKILASPVRLKIIYLLSQQAELSVGAIRKQVAEGHTLVSYYLIKMSDRGILTRTRRGKEVYYSLADPALADWLELLLRVGRKTDA